MLDLIMETYKSQAGKMGLEDKRVERTSQWTHTSLPEMDTKGLNLEANHEDPTEYVRCMYDLIYLAFKTDSTRIATRSGKYCFKPSPRR